MSPRIYRPDFEEEAIEKVDDKVENEVIDDQLISKKIGVLLIEQLQHELSNHNLYSTFSTYFASKGLEKLAVYYKGRASEEYQHHMWIANYLKACNVFFAYPCIPETKININDNITPFSLTVDVEKKTTNMINAIVKAANDEGDYITVSVLQGKDADFGNLVMEQLEEMKLSVDALNIATEKDSDWLAKQDAILNLYQ